MRGIAGDFSDYGALVYPAPSLVRRAYTMHALLSLAPTAWPDETLRRKLLALLPHYVIDINPESVL